jgi:hypothetical protein
LVVSSWRSLGDELRRAAWGRVIATDGRGFLG